MEGLPGFVALQMTDHAPAGKRKIALCEQGFQLGPNGFGFLNVVLAEFGQTRVDRRGDAFDGLALTGAD